MNIIDGTQNVRARVAIRKESEGDLKDVKQQSNFLLNLEVLSGFKSTLRKIDDNYFDVDTGRQLGKKLLRYNSIVVLNQCLKLLRY